jgi:serine/threonine protein kinase
MFAFDSFASGAIDIEDLASELYEIASEHTSAIGDALALLDHHHRLGTLTSDNVQRVTLELERAAREAPATGPAELSAYVSQRLGMGAASQPAESGEAFSGHTVSMPSELRTHDETRGEAIEPRVSFDQTRSLEAAIREPTSETVIIRPEPSLPPIESFQPRSEPSIPSFGPAPGADRSAPEQPAARVDALHPRQPVTGAAPRPVGPGTVLRNRYVLDREIGSGGMGTVYRALDRNRLGLPEEIRCIAVKVLHPDLASRPDALQTLRQEFYQAQSLSHPGIVNVFDFDQDAHVHFMTMELLDGEQLSDLLGRIHPNRLRRDVAMRLLRDLGLAVAYAHERGVLHRDLKPGNVMVSRRGEVRVLDFGLGRFQLREPWISDTDSSFDAATPTYSSCERLAGKYPDSRDDVFSFACIAYEVLAGRHPFGRKSARDARDEGLKPRRIGSLTGRQWRTLKQGLAWDRDDRPGTINEMLVGLGLVDRVPSSSGTGVAPDEERAWQRTALTAITALVAFAAIGFAGWTLYQQRDRVAALLGSSADQPSAGPGTSATDQSASASGNGAATDNGNAAIGSNPAPTTAPPSSPAASNPAALPGDVVGVVTSGVAGSDAATPAPPNVDTPATAPPPTVSLAEKPAAESPSPTSAGAAAGTTPAPKPAPGAGSGPGQLSFTVSSLPVSESAGTARLTVRRHGGSDGTVSFRWHTVDDSAVGGTDYAPTTSARETLGPGQTSVNLLIPLVGDSVHEPTRLFDVVIDDFTGGAKRGAITRATVAIVDDD